MISLLIGQNKKKINLQINPQNDRLNVDLVQSASDLQTYELDWIGFHQFVNWIRLKIY